MNDFDAVSLYPSAMNRLWTVTGTPEVIPESYLRGNYLLNHLFDVDQLEPTKEKFISAFVVEIEITKVNKKLHFPIITKRENLVNNYVNECVTMVVTDIALEDLIKFQKIEYKVIKGYWWKTSRKHTIRNVIRKLFELRLKYKKEGNSLQEIIKLILNSAYGKSIQKPVETSIIYVNDKNKDECIFKKFNMFKSGEKINDEQWLLKFNKGINNQFANVLFGALVLDMSKRIMNEVMCLAEDLDIKIYYQDTDSMHIEADKVELLATEFKEKYSRELIGSDMGQFHNDFPGGSDVYAVESYFLAKKIYIDKLSTGEHHIRMKGIPNDVIK